MELSRLAMMSLFFKCKPSYRENDGGSNVGSLDVKATEDDQSNTETLLNPEIKYLSGAPSSPEDESHSYALLEFHNEDACDAQESDSLGDLWKEMSLALEYSKVFSVHYFSFLQYHVSLEILFLIFSHQSVLF